MRSFLGKEVGAAGNIPYIDRLTWVDLTAGDAAPVDGEEWIRSSSPGILAHHATQASKPVTIDLYEIQPRTFDRLVANLNERLPTMGYVKIDDARWGIDGRAIITAHNVSGHEASVSTIDRRTAAMVFNDPNAITTWAMRDGFAAEVAQRTPWFRCMSTLGCNPGGQKRLAMEERALWGGYVGDLEGAAPTYRDLLLAVIERDADQWAYLLATPVKWRTGTERMVETAFIRTGKKVAMAWGRRDRSAYEEAKRTLFLTKAERKAAEVPMLPLEDSDAA